MLHTGRSADAQEGVTSFLEKRPPRFTGQPQQGPAALLSVVVMTTPLTVHLPYNRDILGADFMPAKRGEKPAKTRGHWRPVQGQTLPHAGRLRPPSAQRRLPPPARGAAPFWLGTYHDAPCWVVPVAADAALPAGLARETLVPMRGARLPDELLSLGGMAMQALWWESTSGHCPRCGGATEAHRERVGQALPGCRYEHSRTGTRPPSCSSAIGDRVLLTRKAEWAPGPRRVHRGLRGQRRVPGGPAWRARSRKRSAWT